MNYIINNRVQVTHSGMSSVGLNEPEIVLTATPMRLLTYLVENPNRVISREELFEYIWGERGLTPSGTSLSQYLSVIRRNFQRYGFDDTIIENIPKEGVRFNATVINPLETKGTKKTRSNVLRKGMLGVLRNINENIYWLVVVIIFVVVVVHFTLSKFTPHSDLHYAGWVRYEQMNQCEVYFPESEISNKIKKIYSQRTKVLLKILRINCGPEDRVLVFLQNPLNDFNRSPSRGREFIAHCTLLKESYYCYSYYFLHGGDL
ncbi:putative membrane protein [Enterobacter sp. J49]|uniref:winged helix-turn-helix domain-containing protein n=1 Tax=Enterobacter sp. J49 TaxID=1903627 RepID=UPI000A38058B|nr:winged helix-turn-helix domain-containing protein [Enterobacter sp. J49]OUC37070.1 putative membrane protein [Enterobacter sp. J49]